MTFYGVTHCHGVDSGLIIRYDRSAWCLWNSELEKNILVVVQRFSYIPIFSINAFQTAFI
jgi:hypothetical protein